MPDGLVIQSHTGPYAVRFFEGFLDDQSALLTGTPHFLVDGNIARIYSDSLHDILARSSTIVIEATEENKSIDKIIPVIERLVASKVRRGHSLVAIGGGIIQDITCFIASVLLRGMNWKFVPTTLLAQADSCIGSKSSINLSVTKNILGTFNPPREIFICTEFIDTLERKDIHSGIGEVLKVHAIDGAESYDRVAADFDRMIVERDILLTYIRRALLIKQRYIEVDEFDRNVRNIFNYGHSFGHAIESATNFYVPHGIAVSMGMDMANGIAVRMGLLSKERYQEMRPALRKNYADYATADISVEPLLDALLKDKKNTSTDLMLILPNGPEAVIERIAVAPDETFRSHCISALEALKP